MGETGGGGCQTNLVNENCHLISDRALGWGELNQVEWVTWGTPGEVCRGDFGVHIDSCRPVNLGVTIRMFFVRTPDALLLLM